MAARHGGAARAASERSHRPYGTLFRLVLFLALTGTLTVFIAAQIARISLTDSYPLQATFDDASGLTKGDQVKIAGAPVGRVDKVSVVNGRAVVKFSVSREVTVPADSEASIRWRDAIGRRVIYLLPGTSELKMRPGTHITRTRSVVDIGELINEVAPLTETLKPEQINTLIGTLGEALEGNTTNVDRLIGNIDTLSSSIASRRQTLNQMIGDYATITGVVARRDKQIAKAIDDLVSLSDAFVKNRALVDDAIVQLAGMARTTDQALGHNGDVLARIVDRLAVLTAGLNRNTGTVTSLLKDATPKLKRIFSTTDNGHYIYVAAPCVSLAAPPCPYPTKLPGSTESQARPLNSSKSLQRLMVGGGG